MPSFYTGGLSGLKRAALRTRYAARHFRLRWHVRTGAISHLHGPPAEQIECADDELVVLCLMRNAEFWIDSYIRHHQELGARHIVLMDTGSTDSSIARAAGYDHVTILSTQLPFKRWHPTLRRWLIEQFGLDRWSLYCDVDELFDYPHSDWLELRSFLGYLNAHGHTAVAAHMLDMFSDLPFNQLRGKPGESLKDAYRFYDTTDIVWRRDAYWIDRSSPTSARLACAVGGIRKRIFGSDRLILSKHPLLFARRGAGIYAYDSHFHSNVVASDVTAVLLHYKFVSTLAEQASEAVRLAQYSGGSRYYKSFDRTLRETPDLCLRLDTARELTGVQQLVDEGFLVTSPAYEKWVGEHAKDTIT